MSAVGDDGHWRLIAVLQSTVFLPARLGVMLYRVAVKLQRFGEESEALSDPEVAVGVVRRLKRELLIGTFGGPGFEAELITPGGSGLVRFIVTREGLDVAEREDSRQRSFERKHWN
jgi:hypothetical protein